MNDRIIRRWALLGALASAALLTSACDREWPAAGSDWEGRANEAQDYESFVDEEDRPGAPLPGTGGAGVQQPQPEEVQPAPPPGFDESPAGAFGAQGRLHGIGAPGYSTPRADPSTTDPYHDEPGLEENPSATGKPYPPLQGRPGSPTQETADQNIPY